MQAKIQTELFSQFLTFTFEERKRKKAVGEKALKKKGRGEFTKRERKTRE